MSGKGIILEMGRRHRSHGGDYTKGRSARSRTRGTTARCRVSARRRRLEADAGRRVIIGAQKPERVDAAGGQSGQCRTDRHREGLSKAGSISPTMCDQARYRNRRSAGGLG